MFAVGFVVVCFYHAERVLFAIVKFLLFTSSGKGGGGLKWEREEVGE